MKSKIIYTETNWRKDPNLIPMQITYKRYRQSDWETDMSGEYVYCGNHSVKRLEIVVEVPAYPHWQGGMTVPYFHTLKRWEFHRDSKNNTEYQSRLQIAKNWISKFRTLTEAKDYWCYEIVAHRMIPVTISILTSCNHWITYDILQMSQSQFKERCF